MARKLTTQSRKALRATTTGRIVRVDSKTMKAVMAPARSSSGQLRAAVESVRRSA